MHDLIIIGAGPAGLTAGLYAGRFRLDAVILERLNTGGQIVLSPTIENFPGFPQGMATIELIERIKSQVDEVGIPVIRQAVIGITASAKHGVLSYALKTEEKAYEARALIIASGAQAKRLGVPGEDKFIGRGVSYCGTCDAPFFKNKEIVVVGGGDRAIEEAIFLAGYAAKVTLIHRRQEFRASKILEEKLRKNPKINFILNTVVEEIGGKEKVEAVKLKNLKDSTVIFYPSNGVFVFVGIKPNTDFLEGLLQLDESGFIISGHDMETSREGIFACGDCRKKSLYQVINACGEAAVAANSTHKYLLNLGG